MLPTAPTYTTSARFSSPGTCAEPCRSMGDAGRVLSKRSLHTIGGGYASNLISVDYIEPYSLLRALCASVGSRLFCVNTLNISK